MFRTLLWMAVATLMLGNTGCTSFCKKLFGMDKRCDTPPPCYTAGPPPMVAAPAGPPPAVHYQPAPPCATPH